MHTLKRLGSYLATLLVLNACVSGGNVQVSDYVIGGYEGAAGGAIACTEVHTLFTDIPPVHYGLSDCLRRLVGKVYLDGAAFSQIQANIDTLCAQGGECTYEQEQAVAAIKMALARGQMVNPKRRHHH